MTSYFREGWRARDATAGRAHFFRRQDAGLAVAICGAQDAPAGWLIESGSLDRCERCAKILEKEGRKAAQRT